MALYPPPDLLLFEIVQARSGDCARAFRWLQPMVAVADDVLAGVTASEWALFERSHLATPWHAARWRGSSPLGADVRAMDGLSEHVGRLGTVAAACVANSCQRDPRQALPERLLRTLVSFTDEQVVALHAVVEAMRALPAAPAIGVPAPKALVDQLCSTRGERA